MNNKNNKENSKESNNKIINSHLSRKSSNAYHQNYGVEKFEGTFEKEEFGVTIICNETLNSIRNPESLGVYIYLLGRPKGWKLNAKQLCEHFQCGKERIYRILNFLLTEGFITCITQRDKGKFSRFHYRVHLRKSTMIEKPVDFEIDQPITRASIDSSPFPEKPDTVKPDTVFQDTYKTKNIENKEYIKNTIVDFKKSTESEDEEFFEFEEFEKPDYETEQALEISKANNPLSPEVESTKPDYSKNQVKINTIKPKSNHNTKKEYKEDPLFMAFYSAYPNKQKPRVAYKAFLRLEPNFEFVKQIINDVKTRMENNWRGRDKSKIPFPATYLNSFEWEGEIFLPASDSHYKPKSSARYDDHDTSWINMESL